MKPKSVQILGDYAEFYAQQAQRLLQIGIHISAREVSHLAFRTETLAEYLAVHQQLESIRSANVENVWNGRPISKLLLQEPLLLAPNVTTTLIELIPPVHQGLYKMVSEHVGIVVGTPLQILEYRTYISLPGNKTRDHSVSLTSSRFRTIRT